jgi:hypothetical protein
MCVLTLCPTFIRNISYSEQNLARYYHKRTNGLRVKYPLVLSDINEIRLFSKYFRKYSNITFHDNLPSGSRPVPCGRTARHDDANSRSSQLLNAPSKNGNKTWTDRVNTNTFRTQIKPLRKHCATFSLSSFNSGVNTTRLIPLSEKFVRQQQTRAQQNNTHRGGEIRIQKMEQNDFLL